MFPLHPHDPPSVGPYRTRARLGEDTHTRVYLGVGDDGAPVAVKVVRPEHATDPTFRATFGRRVEAARGSAGAHVCAVRDADTRGAVPWVALSRPLGPTLTEFVRVNGPLPVDALRPLALALAQGLADLHGAGLTHGSLWPDGVLLTDPTAILADPGLDRAIFETEQRAPHPVFLAPEGGTAPATDVFSWAATLCYGASGVEGPEGLAQVPLQLRGLVDTCLKRDPRLRPSAVDLVRMLGGPTEPPAWSPPVRSAIEEVAERQRSALVSPTPDASPKEGDRGRRRLLALGAGALALVLLGTAGAVYAYDRLTENPEPATGSEVEGGTLVTEGSCLDATGFPPPEETVPEDTGTSDLVFSADGDALAVTSAVGLMIWDWREREEIARPTTSLTSVGAPPVFSSTGCTVAAVVPVGYQGREYPVNTVHTYDLISGTTTPHLGPQEGPDENERWSASPRNAQAFDFSPEGSRLALTLDVGFQDGGSTHVVDTATGEPGKPLAAGKQNSTAFVDEDHIAAYDLSEIHVWNVDTGQRTRTIRGVTDRSFSVVPADPRIAYRDDDRIIVADHRDGSRIAAFPREEFETDDEPILNQLLLDPEQNTLYVSWMVSTGPQTWRYHWYAWDLESGEDLLADVEELPYRRIALHPQGEVIAATLTDDTPPVLLDPDTYERIGTLY